MATETKKPGEQETDPNDPASQLPEGAPDGLKQATRGEKTGVKEEAGALDFLLGETKRLQFEVPVQLDTESGPKELIFVIQQLDGKRILALEDEYRTGPGPLAPLDNIGFNAALVAEATVLIKDKEAGTEVDPKSEQFRGPVPSSIDAMRARFTFQHGLLDGVAAEVRRIAGEATDRVGRAQRSTTNAVGNSSGSAD